MNTYIEEWQMIVLAYIKHKEDGNVDLKILRENALHVRDKLLIRYGVYQDLLDYIKPTKSEQRHYQEKMDDISALMVEINLTLKEMEETLVAQGVSIRPSMVNGNVETLIQDTFRKEVFELLVKQERRSIAVTETKRVEMRFPANLLRDIDEYQEINELSNRSQTIFELCRMGLKTPVQSTKPVIINSSMQRLKDNYLVLKDMYEQQVRAIEEMHFLLKQEEEPSVETRNMLKRVCEKAIREQVKYEKITDGVVK